MILSKKKEVRGNERMFIFTTKQFTLKNIDDTLARRLALHKEFLAIGH